MTMCIVSQLGIIRLVVQNEFSRFAVATKIFFSPPYKECVVSRRYHAFCDLKTGEEKNNSKNE